VNNNLSIEKEVPKKDWGYLFIRYGTFCDETLVNNSCNVLCMSVLT